MPLSWLLSTLASAALLPTVPLQESVPEEDEVLWIHAKRLVLRPGAVVEGGALLVRGGIIVAVGEDVVAPEGARKLEGEVACAGFVDGWSSLALDPASATDLGTAAATRTVDALDPFRLPYQREEALQGGVTSQRVQVGRMAQFGGVGTVLRTDPERAEVLLEDACVSATIGITRGGRAGDVFDRVGEVDRLVSQIEKGRTYRESEIEYRHELEAWEKAIAEKRKELDEEFKKAKKKREKGMEEAEEKGKEFKEERYKEDKKPRKPRWDPSTEVLARVANGELPLVVEVHGVPELRSLLEKTAGFDRLRLVLAGCTDAVHVAEEIAERRIPVLLWPTAEPGDGGEYERHDLALAGALERAGVEVLFGSGGRALARDLRLLAAQAVGHGLDREAALHALTLGPARAFDVADRVGTLERGKHADVLLFDGDPLGTNSRIRTVISRGRVVVEQ